MLITCIKDTHKVKEKKKSFFNNQEISKSEVDINVEREMYE